MKSLETEELVPKPVFADQVNFKIRLISKFMTSQTGKQIIVTQILSNISRSQGNQRIKFDQLIEYNLRNIFLEKSYTKWGAETIPKLFSKK